LGGALGDYTVAAFGNPASQETIDRLALANSRYFNSGVLLINLTQWRQTQISELAFNFIKMHSEKILWWDQDALNKVFDGSFLWLDVKWNTLIDLAAKTGEIRPDTAIIHFTGAMKPWQRWCSDSRKSIYWHYLQRSPWCEAQPHDPQTIDQALACAAIAKQSGDPEEAIFWYELVITHLMAPTDSLKISSIESLELA